MSSNETTTNNNYALNSNLVNGGGG